MSISKRIVAAYRELAGDKGFHSVTMDQVASQAGLSKRTVYRYFYSKEAIIEAIINAFMAEVTAESERLLATVQDPAGIMAASIKYLFHQGRFLANPQSLKDLQQFYPHLWKKIDAFRADRIQYILEALIKRDSSGVWRGTDPRILTAVVLAAVQAVVNPDFILKNSLTFEETVNQMSQLLTQLVVPSDCPGNHKFAKIEIRN